MNKLDCYTLALKTESLLYTLMIEIDDEIATTLDADRRTVLTAQLPHFRAAYELYQKIIRAFVACSPQDLRGLIIQAGEEVEIAIGMGV